MPNLMEFILSPSLVLSGGNQKAKQKIEIGNNCWFTFIFFITICDDHAL
jgi:hypothetical protein